MLFNRVNGKCQLTVARVAMLWRHKNGNLEERPAAEMGRGPAE